MCLTKLISGRDKNASGVGYMVFSYRGGQYYGIYQNINKARSINKWINEIDYRRNRKKSKILITYNMSKIITYFTGWHIFKRMEDAIRYKDKIDSVCPNCIHVIRKVQYRNVRAVGIKPYVYHKIIEAECIVAKEIFIERKKYAKRRIQRTFKFT